MSNHREIPLMFQAQIKGRGQIQYIAKPEKAYRWVDEWTEGVGNDIPHFSDTCGGKLRVITKEYKITWRFISNSGQDDDIIRPVIAAAGFPYYPGASMKGAFRRSCTPEQAIRYCGGISNQKDSTTKPGILRFHGGYPKDATWKDKELVDVVHPQADWQIKNNNSHSAFIQISLHEPILVFGISSNLELDSNEWDTIWSIWEKALERGIGSRVSAGYGQPVKHPETKLLTVGLSGQGLASQLINKTGEFRPNMFKAALRGHTLRLFAGVTDENSAEALTRELWGGFAGKDGAVVGLLGIAFNAIELDMDEYRYRGNSMPIYELNNGSLHILSMRSITDEYKVELRLLAMKLVQFSLLLGGFGKSWRRIDHRIFFPDYLNNNQKPMIGCHWEFNQGAEKLYIPTNKLENISKFLTSLNEKINQWVIANKKMPTTDISEWREVWHPQKVQVWGRIAEDEDDSLAVRWFHGAYKESQSIKGSTLTGTINQIGRIWHRMYPRYSRLKDGTMRRMNDEYIELITIFPDSSDATKEFIEFLGKSDFSRIYPN
jgi:CRISPR-associated protein Cmr6